MSVSFKISILVCYHTKKAVAKFYENLQDYAKII